MADGFEQAKSWPIEAWPKGERPELVTFPEPRLLAGGPYPIPGTSPAPRFVCYWAWLLCGRVLSSAFEYTPGDNDGNEARKQLALQDLIAFAVAALQSVAVPEGGALPPLKIEEAQEAQA